LPGLDGQQTDEAVMAFNLKLSRVLTQMRWKVKIRDKERVEDPHFTIIHGTVVWRVCLRDGRFMDLDFRRFLNKRTLSEG